MEQEYNNHSVIAHHNNESYFYKPCNWFDDIGYPKQFQDCATILNIEKPTPVQSYAIPLVLENKNVFVKAETGSGKTLAFLMPILFNLTKQLSLIVDEVEDELCHPRCVIVAPTRELAIQIHRLCYRLTKVFSFVKCSLIVGGVNKNEQVAEMMKKKANVIISTPGRVLDLMNLQLPKVGDDDHGEEEKAIQYLSLDRIECLIYPFINQPDHPSQNLGFKEQLNLMFGALASQQYQIVCCSATFTDKIRDSVERWCPDRYEVEIPNNSIIVNTDSEVSINPLITQDVQLCSEHKKLRKLFDFIRYVQEEDEKNHVRQKSIALIFVNKMKTGEFVLKFVRENWSKGPSGKQKQGRIKPSPKEGSQEDETELKSLRIDFLNSKMTQPYPFISISSYNPSFSTVREKVLNSFKSGKTQFLITTDVVNRGIDIPNLNYVLNYDFPTNLVTYVHRIGRTGRNNTPGYSRSFITRNMSPLVPDLVLLLEANKQKVPKLLAELAEEQKRLIEFGKWENEINAAIQEGKSVEEITKEVQLNQPAETKEKVEETKEKVDKPEEKVIHKPVASKPVDAEGRIIQPDSNWKSFLVKNGKTEKKKGKTGIAKRVSGKTTNQKQENVSEKPIVATTKKEKVKITFFGDEKEKSTKKVPLIRKHKK